MKYEPKPCCSCCNKAVEHERDNHKFTCPTHPPKKSVRKGVQQGPDGVR